MHPRQSQPILKTQGVRLISGTWVAIAVVIIILLVGSAVGVRARFAGTAATGKLTVTALQLSTAQAPIPRATLRAGVSINLTRFGFEPAEITIPQEEYFVSVRNLTDLSDIHLSHRLMELCL